MNKKIISITAILCVLFLLIYVPAKNKWKYGPVLTYVENTTYKEEILTLNPTENEIQLLAQFIKHEAGNEDVKAKLTVGLVILNRTNSPNPEFPNKIDEVIKMPGYFALPEAGLETIEITENDISIAKKVINIFNEQTPLEDENGNNLIQAFYWYNPAYMESEEAIKNLEATYPPLGQIGERKFLAQANK